MIQSYRDLRVWQMGMDLTVELYKTTQTFPSEEKFGLTSQIRRAASSIPANIAEGHARGRKEYQQFLRIAAGSLTELETHLMISQRVGLLPEAKLEVILRTTDQLGRMLNKLRSSLGIRDSGSGISNKNTHANPQTLAPNPPPLKPNS